MLVWTLIVRLFIGNTLLLALNPPLAPLWAKLLRIPRPYLYAGILFFATLGAPGYMARRFGFSVLPIIVGSILGPELERQLRRALQISAGDPAALLSEPLAVVVCSVIVLFLVRPPLVTVLMRRFGRGSRPTSGPPEDQFGAFGTQTSDGSARVIHVVRSKSAPRKITWIFGAV